jgi:hypothetical protein
MWPLLSQTPFIQLWPRWSAGTFEAIGLLIHQVLELGVLGCGLLITLAVGRRTVQGSLLVYPASTKDARV